MNRRVKLLRVVWLSIIASLILPVPPGLAQKGRSKEKLNFASVPKPANGDQDAKDVQQAAKVFNGVWKLKRRINPDGTVQAKVDGVTTINMVPFYSRFGKLPARALGTITAQEYGVHDPRCPTCVPKEFLGQNFEIESSGIWGLNILPKGDSRVAKLDVKNLKDNEFLVVVNGYTRVRGNYTPYQKGVNMPVTAYYRVSRDKLTAKLLNSVGNATYPEGNQPYNDWGEVIDQQLLEESACNCESFEVVANMMKIRYVIGVVDEWVRDEEVAASPNTTTPAEKASPAGKVKTRTDSEPPTSLKVPRRLRSSGRK